MKITDRMLSIVAVITPLIGGLVSLLLLSTVECRFPEDAVMLEHGRRIGLSLILLSIAVYIYEFKPISRLLGRQGGRK